MRASALDDATPPEDGAISKFIHAHTRDPLVTKFVSFFFTLRLSFSAFGIEKLGKLILGTLESIIDYVPLYIFYTVCLHYILDLC